MIELQGILKQYGKNFLENYKLSCDQTKAFRAILNCRTATLGGHADTCDQCGFQRISYNSCRNRNCPKCQTFAKEQWIEKQNESLLNVGYFHVVFTFPDTLNTLVYQNQAVVYNLFFKAMSETLLELGFDEKYLGAKLGITAVLHTWGQNLLYHPHIHCIIPGGGLTADGKWLSSRKKFFMPIKVLSKKFRGKFLFYLKRAKLCFFSDIKYLENPREFDAFISNLYQKDWVIPCIFKGYYDDFRRPGDQLFRIGPDDGNTEAYKQVITFWITPSNPQVDVGATVSFRANAMYEDGSQEDVTSKCIWVSSDPGTVSLSGTSVQTASAVKSGSAVIRAEFIGYSNSTSMVVV